MTKFSKVQENARDRVEMVRLSKLIFGYYTTALKRSESKDRENIYGWSLM